MKRLMKILFENRKIILIPRPIRKIHVNIRRRLYHRIVMLLMNRERKHALIAPENRGRPVSMMNVRIHHHRCLDRALRLHPPNRDRHIVDHAKPLSMIRKGMMKSAANIRGPSIRKRTPRRQNRPARRQPASVHQLLRIRNLQHHDFGVRKRPRLQLANIIRSVNTQNVFILRRRRRQEIAGRRDAISQQAFVDQPVFLRRKYMRAQVQIVAIVVNKFEWKHDFVSLPKSISEGKP